VVSFTGSVLRFSEKLPDFIIRYSLFVIRCSLFVIRCSFSGFKPWRIFTSIPKSIYWAIVTLTTVGYGDIAPKTPLGQILAGMVMLLGYGIIAIPTGIVTVEMANATRRPLHHRVCPNCLKENHEFGANYCSACGTRLDEASL
jgi:voltage-gated potassium channel Kch